MYKLQALQNLDSPPGAELYLHSPLGFHVILSVLFGFELHENGDQPKHVAAG